MRPFIFKATVRRLDWMVMALICLYPARYFGEEPTKKGEGVISWMGKRFPAVWTNVKDDVILKILKLFDIMKFFLL